MKRSAPPETVASERITLRKHALDLAETMFRHVDRDRERLRVFLPWVDMTRTVNDERGYIEMTHEKWADGTLFDYGIYLNEGGLYVGNIGAHSISWEHERCELGYWILGAHEGKGYVAEAVRALEQALFALGFNRVEIRCSSGNDRSARVPVSCGYRLEGTLRQDMKEHGVFRDTLVFGRLRGDGARG